MKKARIVIAIVVALVVLALLLSRCSSSSSSPADSQVATPASQATEELSLIGVQCETPGEVLEKSGASFVCTPTKKAGETKAVYYGVAIPADEPCDAPGQTRSVEGVFSVCADDSEPTKRKWLVTVPMPVAVTAFIEPGDSTEPAALEEAGVTVPEAIAALPGMEEFAVASPPTEPSPTIAPTPSQATTAPTTPQTTAAGETTLSESTTTSAQSTTSSAASTTTDETTTTGAPTTTAAPTTTMEESATTVAPATTAALTCAQGGKCKNGDIGPAGGLVLLADFMLSEPATLIEVAPVTWFGDAVKAKGYTRGLTFGGFDDWELPDVSQLLTMRRERAHFVCTPGVPCTNGFNNSTYWASYDGNPLRTVNFAGSGDAQAAGMKTMHFVRPVRLVLPAEPVLTIEEIEPS